MDDASIRLARVEDWLRLARSGCLGDHLVRCTWSQVADDIEFYVYPERCPDGQADAGREDEQQAEAGAGVGPGPAESVGEANEALIEAARGNICRCYNHEALGHAGWCPEFKTFVPYTRP